ncbi:MAG: HI0074 family nucleotidyltransferase substrate-binding subunit [Spirochaetia bacterium]|nr:HI0074 family nucleotidyltransferase substrate-binding subunit [Spirochaetia bacterium]
MDTDIRWIQRFDKYKKAFSSLTSDVELAKKRKLSDIEQRGLIQAFEYTYELAWNTIKDFYGSIGETEIQGSKDAYRMAFNRELVSNKTLIETVRSRQLTSHTYNEETADEIFNDIINKYFDAFKELLNNLEKQKKQRDL